MASAVVVFVNGDPAVNPIAGTYHGLAALDGLWRKFFSIFDRAEATLEENPRIQCVGNELLAWAMKKFIFPAFRPSGPGL